MTANAWKKVSNIWSELRRRRVVSTTVAYLIGAWILIEISSTVFPLLLLPEWTARFIAILAALGLPIIVVLAWVFDIRRSPKLSADETAPGVQAHTTVKDNGQKSQTTLPPESASVAVMRFENFSTDDKHKFVADGIATELHSTLAQVHHLRVASRTSSFALTNSESDVKEIASKLNVGFVVSGSVRCIDNRMRVIVELDNATEGVQIWSQTYERDTSDVFGVQHEIACSIASAFGGARMREEIADAAMQPTESLDAWNLVQRARSYLIAYSPESLADARLLLNRAIDLDADYAVAHAALGSVISEQVLTAYSENYEKDRDAALRSADTATSLSPSDPFVLKSCGLIWSYFGRHRKSLESLRRAVQLAPFDLGAWGYHGWPLVETGIQSDLHEVEKIMGRIISTSPQHPGVPFWLYHQSVAKTCSGNHEAAVEIAATAVKRNYTFAWGWMHYANALGQAGDTEKSLNAIKQCQKISAKLTPTYYARMIRDMSATGDIAELRLRGLGRPGN